MKGEQPPEPSLGFRLSWGVIIHDHIQVNVSQVSRIAGISLGTSFHEKSSLYGAHYTMLLNLQPQGTPPHHGEAAILHIYWNEPAPKQAGTL